MKNKPARVQLQKPLLLELRRVISPDGLTTKLYVNGKPINNASGFSFVVDGDGTARAEVTFVGRLKMKINDTRKIALKGE